MNQNENNNSNNYNLSWNTDRTNVWDRLGYSELWYLSKGFDGIIKTIFWFGILNLQTNSKLSEVVFQQRHSNSYQHYNSLLCIDKSNMIINVITKLINSALGISQKIFPLNGKNCAAIRWSFPWNPLNFLSFCLWLTHFRLWE